MKNSKILLALTLSLTMMPSLSKAVQVDGMAVIKVETQLSATSQRPLDFGTVVQDANAGTVAATDANASALFDVAGEPGKSYTISLPSAPIVMKKGAGGTPVTEIEVNSFTSNKTGGVSTLDAQGADSFQVGGTHAKILQNQESGSYEGSFTVDLVYN